MKLVLKLPQIIGQMGEQSKDTYGGYILCYMQKKDLRYKHYYIGFSKSVGYQSYDYFQIDIIFMSIIVCLNK